MGIGKLTEVDVRDLWKHEQYDFSEWLAKCLRSIYKIIKGWLIELAFVRFMELL